MNGLTDLADAFETGAAARIDETPDGDARHRKRAARSGKGSIGEFGAAFDLRSAVAWLEQDQRSRVVVDRGLRVLWANAAAQANLRPPMPVFLAGGGMAFGDDVDPAACREFVRGASPEMARRALVSSSGESFGVLNVWSQKPGPAAPIFVRVAVSQPMLDLRGSGMVAQFGLTRAEGDIAQHLALLHTPAGIARELGLSVHTVRTHIRRIYAKLSIRSQTQFMRLAHTFAWA